MARAEYNYSQRYVRTSNVSGMRAMGRFELDARNSTEYGLLRAYTRVDFGRRTGSLTSATGNNQGYNFTGGVLPFGVSNINQQIDISRAFVQLGGFTAGRTVSFFGFYNADLEYVGVTLGDGLVTQVFAYTATFGQGFSATLSIEDPNERRGALGYAGANSYMTISGAGTGTNYTYYNYGGAIMPEIVGALRVDQSWGSAQLSGAIHQIRSAGAAQSNTTSILPLATSGAGYQTAGLGGDTDYGFAIQAGVKFNLPMIAAGDALYLQGTYTNGASSYIITSAPGNNGGGTVGAGKLTVALPDAVITGTQANANLSTVTAWGLTAGLNHYWTPTIRQAIFGTYGQLDVPGAASAAAGGNTLVTNPLRNATYWAIGSNVIWSPIKGLDLGLEVNYQSLSAAGAPMNANVSKVQAVGGTVSEGSAITSRIRVQRTF